MNSHEIHSVRETALVERKYCFFICTDRYVRFYTAGCVLRARSSVQQVLHKTNVFSKKIKLKETEKEHKRNVKSLSESDESVGQKNNKKEI